jgi:hypothetical protein
MAAKRRKVLQKIEIVVYADPVDGSSVHYSPGIPELSYQGGHGLTTYDRIDTAVGNLIAVARAIRAIEAKTVVG